MKPDIVPTTHELKILREYYEAVLNGAKTFELRMKYFWMVYLIIVTIAFLVTCCVYLADER